MSQLLSDPHQQPISDPSSQAGDSETEKTNGAEDNPTEEDTTVDRDLGHGDKPGGEPQRDYEGIPSEPEFGEQPRQAGTRTRTRTITPPDRLMMIRSGRAD